MKARLTYNLPDDAKDHLRAVKSLDMALALWDVDKLLRSVEKYQDEPDIVKIRSDFYDILEKYDINLDTVCL